MSVSSPGVIAAAGLVALAVAMGIGRFAFTPLFPMMQADHGLSVAAGGWLAAANYAGYFAGALAAMILCIQAAQAIRIALVTIGGSTLAMGITENFVAWLALRALAGVASAWVLVFISSSVLPRLATADRLTLGGIVYAGVGTGIAVVGFACLVLMHTGVNASGAWIALGTAALVATAILRFAVADEIPPLQPVTNGNWAPGYTRLAVCYGILGFGYIVPATFLSAMAKAAVPDPMLFGWTWPVFGLAAAFSTVAVAPAARRFGYRGIWIAANLVMGLGVSLPLWMPGLPGLIVSALFVGGTFMVITMAGLQEARRAAGANARTLMAAMTSAFALGQIVGPALVALLARVDHGMKATLLLASVLLFASTVVLHRNAEQTRANR